MHNVQYTTTSLPDTIKKQETLAQVKAQATVQHIAPKEVASVFQALLETTDFATELQLLKVGRFRRALRQKLVQELQGIYAGLWFLGLLRSFPHSAYAIFDCFLDEYITILPYQKQDSTRNTMIFYRDMIFNSGDKDFSSVSRHLLTFIETNETTLKADILRLTLVLRNAYTFIFQRLL